MRFWFMARDRDPNFLKIITTSRESFLGKRKGDIIQPP